jgi:anti-sigma-K factor RskA
MNTDNERDDLWDLLGKAKQAHVSPFFSRDVLRKIRLQQEQQRSPLRWLARQWRIAALSAACATLMVVAFNHRTGNAPDAAPVSAVELVQQTDDKSDYETIAHLDELVAYENNSIWLDNSSE